MTEDQKQSELHYSEGLRDAVWHWQVYQKPRPSWDHDHCRICGTRIAEADYGDPEAVQAAYKYIFPPDPGDKIERYEWVCADCFAELKDTFHWRVEADRANSEPSAA